MGERRDDPEALLGRSPAARRPAARRLPRAAAGWRARCAQASSRSAADTAFAGVMRGLRRAAARPSRDLDQRADPARSTASCSRAAMRTASNAGATASWSAGSTACRSARAFFGESMFSRERDASKVALVHLVARLIKGGFRLLDSQFMTEHLRSFGAIEMPREEFRVLLADAVDRTASFQRELGGEDPCAIVQASTRTS